MPSPSVINFGADPYANAMGGLARNFLQTINEKTGQKRNEDLFRNIAEKYGDKAHIEDVYKDVMKTEGFDQEYKRDKLKELIDYAKLANKSDRNPYEEAKLKLRLDELDVRKESNRIASVKAETEQNKSLNTSQSNKNKISKDISAYTSKLLKDDGVKLDFNDKNDLNDYIESYVTDKENPLSLPDATAKAFDYISQRRDIIDNVKITPKPYWSTNVKEEMPKAIADLQKLYDEDGITSQKALREIAQKANWSTEETTEILRQVLKRDGRKLKGPKPKSSEEETAEIDKAIGF